MAHLGKITVYDAKEYEKAYYLSLAEAVDYEFVFINDNLNTNTVDLAKSSIAIFCFVNDDLGSEVLTKLNQLSIKNIFLRCAGFNKLDIDLAKKLGINVARVPAYSPESISEFTLALLLNLNRKIHKSYQRTREFNFDLNNLVGTNINGKEIGVIGTGNIGSRFAKVCLALGAKITAYDINPNEELIKLGIQYDKLDSVLQNSDILSFHCPLTTETKHIINTDNVMKLKKSCKIINTGRGALIEAKALIKGLKTKHLGGVALDVYEEEEGLFFKDHSFDTIEDETILRLLSFPNVILSSHQAYLTEESLKAISSITMDNLKSALNNTKNNNFLC